MKTWSPGFEPPWQGIRGSAVHPLSGMPGLGGKSSSLGLSLLLATKSLDRAPSKICKEAGGQSAILCFLHVGGCKMDSYVPTLHVMPVNSVKTERG